LNVGNPAVRWGGGGLRDQLRLRDGGRIRLTRDGCRIIPSDFLADRLGMSKHRGDEFLIDGNAIATRPWNLRVKELRILPNLGSVGAEREP